MFVLELFLAEEEVAFFVPFFLAFEGFLFPSSAGSDTALPVEVDFVAVDLAAAGLISVLAN